MLTTLGTILACFVLAIACWRSIRLYYLARGIPATSYHVSVATIISVILITLIIRVMGLRSDIAALSGIIVMGLFFAEKDAEAQPDPRYIERTVLAIAIGSVCAGLFLDLMSRW